MRRYKSSYKTHRNSRRFAVSLDAPVQSPPRAKVCEDCGGSIEEVMTVNRCFRCEGIRRRAAQETSDPRIARRESILAAFAEEPLSKSEALELYSELAEIDQSLLFNPSDTTQDFIKASWNRMEEIEF